MGVRRRAAHRCAFPSPLYFGYGGAMSPLTNPRARFAAAVQADDAAIDLAEVALLIAAEAYPELDLGRYRATLDALGDGARAHVGAADSDAGRVRALIHYLAREQRFLGNQDDYYDRRNSFLNEVLDRRVGIPITLSLVYMEVGRRVGVSLQGVSFPGHFLVKCMLEPGMVVLDPYLRGASLSVADLQQRLRTVRGGEVSQAIVAGMLVTAKRSEILARMLRNLKQIYLAAEDYRHALPLQHWLVVAAPHDAAEVRERGRTYLRLECYRAALADFERYLELSSDAADLDEIRGHVVELRRGVARLN
jgi:regulator of sirC expression with transglutaminase-like and TPR domain